MNKLLTTSQKVSTDFAASGSPRTSSLPASESGSASVKPAISTQQEHIQEKVDELKVSSVFFVDLS